MYASPKDIQSKVLFHYEGSEVNLNNFFIPPFKISFRTYSNNINN